MGKYFFEGLVTFSAFVSILVSIVGIIAFIIGAEFPVDVFLILSVSVPVAVLCIYLIFKYKIDLSWFLGWMSPF